MSEIVCKSEKHETVMKLKYFWGANDWIQVLSILLPFCIGKSLLRTNALWPCSALQWWSYCSKLKHFLLYLEKGFFFFGWIGSIWRKVTDPTPAERLKTESRQKSSEFAELFFWYIFFNLGCPVSLRALTNLWGINPKVH